MRFVHYRERAMLPMRWPPRPSLPARAGWRHLVHPARSAFAHSAVLRRAGTLSTLLPGTASAGIGSIRESNSGDRSGSAPDPPSGGNGAGTTQSPPPPPSSSHRTHPEVCFYETFIFSSVDLHLILLEEAHRKHGVWLNVPPQLAPSIPNVGPPAVPEPIYPAAQQTRLAAMSAATMDFKSPSKRPRCASGGGAAGEMDLIKDPSCFAYRPTHDPPPFSTTGTRSLWVPAQQTATGGAVAVNGGVPVVSMPTSAPSSKTASCDEVGLAESSATIHMSQTEVQSVAIRSPVDASMLYHCSECGRAFRRHHVAEQHVQQRHMQHGNGRNSSSAVVVEGPGPGEIIGYEERAVSVAAAATTEPSAASSEAHTLPRKAAIGDRREGVSGEVSAATGTTNASSPPKPPSFDRTAAYRLTPRVELPESALIDNLLDDVWDDVALARGDIEKPSGLPTTRADLRQHPKRHYDSFHGRFFIPSVLVVEGTADNRADQGAAGERAAARATPEGAAPGIKRRPSSASSVSSLSMTITRMLPTQRRNPDGTLGAVGAAAAGSGIGGGALGAAPTAQDLSIAELSRHYPNPFGDSPNAALVESEKEPINPFVDVEGQAAAVAAARKAACDNAAQPGEAAVDTADNAASTPVAKEMEWLSQWAARPYACPLCQRRALPDLMRIMAPLLPSSFAAVSETTTSETSTVRADGDGGSATSCPQSGTKGTAVAAVPVMSAATAVASSPRPARGAPPPGSLEDRPLVVDVEAWRWYADRVPRFRLLDSLEDHLQSRHASCCYGDDEAAAARDDEDGGAGRDGVEGLSDADWRRLYQVSRHQQLLARAELLAVREAYRILFPMQQSTSAEAPSSTTSSGMGSSNDVDSDTRKGGAEREAIRDCVGGSGAPPAGESPASRSSNDATATDSTEAPQVHVRSAVNMVLVGTVRDVQEGFLGATRILQYVLAVRNTVAEAPSSASVDAIGSDAAASEEEQEDADADEELIVVRCVGDLVPVTLLAQQVRLGSTMFVAGSLRMNRNIDTVSRRSHAYPYVQVVPPLGCVRVLGA
ncbi:hypothetical protein LSCM4_08164 [Leishmania orientalis]|uniref:C2H2-type domain-containing protein n=1 Tax=Leishmania orientalis TaxID=2249476 RepID=A0A836I4E6_9TRYP|nr:hypothetical protein LSCM4_08164 [Leishmania orientalis]